jgi:hypothetical protein
MGYMFVEEAAQKWGISLNLSPKRARNLVSRSESFTEVFARRETAKSFFAASAAEADVRQTAMV